MPETSHQTWSFGPFTLDEASCDLARDGRPIQIEPQSLRLLVFLIRHRDRVVSKNDLVEAIWQGRAVSDWAISGAVKAVRVALGDTDREKMLVKTIHGLGYRFVADVIARTPERPAAPKSVLLVRVFRTADREDDLDHLALGLTEDLITGLSRNGGVSVLSCNTARALGDDVPAPLYGVTNIIEGSVRRHGEKIRITVSVLDGEGARQTWAESFDLTRESLLAGHDLIRDRLLAILVPNQKRSAERRRGTSNPQAYDAYQKGRYAYFRYEPQAFVEALSHFAEAAELDPDFANAYAQQAYCRTTLYVFGLPVSDVTLDPAEALARRAIACDPAAALGYARLGWILGYRQRTDEAIAAFEAALIRDPDNPEVYLAFGETMNRLSRPQEAGPLLDSVFSKDSYFPPSWEFPRGHRQLLLDKHAEAIGHFRSVLERVERFIPAHVQLARALWETGDQAGARSTVAGIREIAPKFSLAHARRMFPYPVETEARDLENALEGAGMR